MGEKIIIESITLRPKTYAYLNDDSNDRKKAKGTKKFVIKQKLMFHDFKDCWSNNKNVYRLQQRFKTYNHDNITTYPSGSNAFKVCESEMLNSKRFILWKLQLNIVKTINICLKSTSWA